MAPVTAYRGGCGAIGSVFNTGGDFVFFFLDSEEHVMISYQWDTQQTMFRVKQELETQGFTVWMDVEQMEGSILETMARAVEKSSVLLLAVSRKYQNSPNCRSGMYVTMTLSIISHKLYLPSTTTDHWSLAYFRIFSYKTFQLFG